MIFLIFHTSQLSNFRETNERKYSKRRTFLNFHVTVHKIFQKEGNMVKSLFFTSQRGISLQKRDSCRYDFPQETLFFSVFNKQVFYCINFTGKWVFVSANTQAYHQTNKQTNRPPNKETKNMFF